MIYWVFSDKKLKILILVLSLVFVVFLMFSGSHSGVPEPTSYHTGFAAAAISFLHFGAPLGSVHVSLVEKMQSVYVSSPDYFFYPYSLLDFIDSDQIVLESLLPTPHRPMTWFYVGAFYLFGESLSSVILLWGTVFFFGVVASMGFRLSRQSLQAVGLTNFMTMITVICMPFLDSNSLSVINYRTMPLLLIVPVTALILKLVSGTPIPYALITSAIFFGFIFSIRPTSLWMMGAVLASGIVGFWASEKHLRKRFAGGLLIWMFLAVVSFQWISTSQQRINSGQELVEPIAESSRWYSANIGLFADPRLYEAYVCTDDPPTTKVFGINHMECSGQNQSVLSSLVAASNPGNRYSDQTAYNGALRFIEENGLDVELAEEPAPYYGDLSPVFNLNWNAYGEVSRELLTAVVREEPGIVAQNLIVVKPIRLAATLAQQPVSVVRGLIRGDELFTPIFLATFGIGAGALLLRDLYCSRRRALSREVQPQDSRTNLGLSIIVVFAALPSLVFYAESYTIFDFGVGVGSLGLFALARPKKWKSTPGA